MTKGQDYTVSVPIKNLSSLPLHHIKSTVVDNAGHYEVTGKEIVLLPGNDNGLMEMTMRSDMATTTGNWERVSIKLESDVVLQSLSRCSTSPIRQNQTS